MDKAFRLLLPLLADEFIGCQSFQGLEALGEIVGHQEGCQMVTKLLMSIVVVAIDGGFLERSIHALDLAVRPGMIGFGEAMLDAMLGADAVKHQSESITIALPVRKLDAIVSQDRVDLVRDSGDEVA